MNMIETPALVEDLDVAVRALEDFLERHPRPLVLTGAGCSTDSGIPDYRDVDGGWKRRRPVQFADFMASVHMRRRYWARSMRGYPVMAGAHPNATHRWLAAREAGNGLALLVTQNVDGLHRRAGSRGLIDLHGSIHDVICMECGARSDRQRLQHRLLELNPEHAGVAAEIAPDGDADIEDAALEAFVLPDCERCGGLLKPDVVFFGESVPRDRVDRTRAALARADGLLVLGSSLMVFSGFRFCRDAAAADLPMLAVNLGRTRADPLLEQRLAVPCGALFERLEAGGS
ncbi:MAG: NAD-dependent protein deacetylase [Gammaproteobacteria bacterium]|nr:NAD-dependent protein deacetylase [Gammaproteobacteria bacterium]